MAGFKQFNISFIEIYGGTMLARFLYEENFLSINKFKVFVQQKPKIDATFYNQYVMGIDMIWAKKPWHIPFLNKIRYEMWLSNILNNHIMTELHSAKANQIEIFTTTFNIRIQNQIYSVFWEKTSEISAVKWK